MSEEIDETYRENLRRGNVLGAGDYWINAGGVVAILAVVVTVITMFSGGGGSFVPLAGIPLAFMLAVVGYLKKIAAAAQESL